MIFQADVILVDIDGGHIFIPDAINLASLPEPFLSRARHELTMVRLSNLIIVIIIMLMTKMIMVIVTILPAVLIRDIRIIYIIYTDLYPSSTGS